MRLIERITYKDNFWMEWVNESSKYELDVINKDKLFHYHTAQKFKNVHYTRIWASLVRIKHDLR